MTHCVPPAPGSITCIHIGRQQPVKSIPDGYTLLMGANGSPRWARNP